MGVGADQGSCIVDGRIAGNSLSLTFDITAIIIMISSYMTGVWMKNLIIRGIDPRLAKKIETAAKTRNQSMNQWILSALRRITGITKDRELYHDLDALAGGWNESEADAFRKNTAFFEQVDEDIFR